MVRDFVQPTTPRVDREPMARHTSAAGRETNAEGLNAQDRWRANGRCGCENGRCLTRGRTRQDDACADRECDADTQRDDGHIRLGVATSLERLIPTIEQLHDRRTDADDENCRDRQSSSHCSECNTRVSSALLRRSGRTWSAAPRESRQSHCHCESSSLAVALARHCGTLDSSVSQRYVLSQSSPISSVRTPDLSQRSCP